MWILTEEYNEYDQHGEYFVYAWVDKPSKEELCKVINDRFRQDDYLDHVYEGGGRIYPEDHWYNFFKFGE